MGKEGELWHLVEAKRADDSPTIFRIRELAPRLELPRIFVAELPYPVADGSRLPDAPSYRRFATFEEQWLDPACSALGWTPVAVKIEDGSFFIYLYGADEPRALIERLAPFDGELQFFDEHDPGWDEYGALRELLDEAKLLSRDGAGEEAPIPQVDDVALIAAAEPTGTTSPIKRPPALVRAKTRARVKANAKPKARAKSKAKSKAKPTSRRAKPKAKTKTRARK